MADNIESFMYEAVADRLADQALDPDLDELLPEQVEAAISLTAAGSLSDAFWAAYDNEVTRLTDFFLSVRDEPVVRKRMESA